MKRLACTILAVAACTGPSKQTATSTYAAATSQSASALSLAVSGTSHAGMLALDSSEPCPLGGTAAVTGSYDDSQGSAIEIATFDVTIAFSACKLADEDTPAAVDTLDGNLHWTSASSDASFQAALVGSLAWTDPHDSASCSVDLHAAFGAPGAAWGGTICGYDVHELSH